MGHLEDPRLGASLCYRCLLRILRGVSAWCGAPKSFPVKDDLLSTAPAPVGAVKTFICVCSFQLAPHHQVLSVFQCTKLDSRTGPKLQHSKLHKRSRFYLGFRIFETVTLGSCN